MTVDDLHERVTGMGAAHAPLPLRDADLENFELPSCAGRSGRIRLHNRGFVSPKADFMPPLGKIEIMFKRDGKIDVVVAVANHPAVAVHQARGKRRANDLRRTANGMNGRRDSSVRGGFERQMGAVTGVTFLPLAKGIARHVSRQNLSCGKFGKSEERATTVSPHCILACCWRSGKQGLFPTALMISIATTHVRLTGTDPMVLRAVLKTGRAKDCKAAKRAT